VIRTFISLPAGIARMDFCKFLFYSFAGSLPWCFFLAWIGFELGERWKEVQAIFHKLDFLVGALILLGILWFILVHWKRGAAKERG
jgi:membrane protein DedA with SNARE-associated domain